jgi:hypothetical protein
MTMLDSALASQKSILSVAVTHANEKIDDILNRKMADVARRPGQSGIQDPANPAQTLRVASGSDL